MNNCQRVKLHYVFYNPVLQYQFGKQTTILTLYIDLSERIHTNVGNGKGFQINTLMIVHAGGTEDEKTIDLSLVETSLSNAGLIVYFYTLKR